MISAIFAIIVTLLMIPMLLIRNASRRVKDEEPFGKAKTCHLQDPNEWTDLRILAGEKFWNAAKNMVDTKLDEVAEVEWFNFMRNIYKVLYFTDDEGYRHVFLKNPDNEKGLLMEVYENTGDNQWEKIGMMELEKYTDLLRPECEWKLGMTYKCVKNPKSEWIPLTEEQKEYWNKKVYGHN